MATENNHAVLAGTLMGESTFSHQLQGVDFYKTLLQVPRRSGTMDKVPILYGSYIHPVSSGCPCRVEGMVRSYNYFTGEQRHLQVVLFAQTIQAIPSFSGEGQNNVVLTGNVCKSPIFRKTPLGRDICDLLLCVRRPFGRGDYIPCIAWGSAAAYCARVTPGAVLHVQGRFQSREYIKRHSDTLEERRTAYEISLVKVSAF